MTMLGFLAAIAAGFVTPQLDAPVARPLGKLLGKYFTLEATETRLLSFMVAMLIAGVVSVLLASGSTFWVIFGGIIGYFATRIITAIRDAMEARKAG